MEVPGSLLVQCAASLAQARDLVEHGQAMVRHPHGLMNRDAVVGSKRIITRCEMLSDQLETLITQEALCPR